MNDKNEVLIQVQDLKKAFGKLEVLRGISTEIKKGEVVVVIGPSGSGKSTFLRSLNLLEVPTGGTVLFEGTDITDPKTDIDVHRQKIGMVFQSYDLFPHLTVLDNILLAPMKVQKRKKEEVTEEAMKLLRKVGLQEQAGKFPRELSGGQKQRVAIARALSMNPKYLFCDECTSALDPRSTAAILELLKDLQEKFNITIIVVTHEMSVVQSICSRMAILDGGCVSLTGEVQEIFENKPEQLKRLIGLDDRKISVTMDVEEFAKIKKYLNDIQIEYKVVGGM